MRTEDWLEELLEASGSLRRGHFRLSSGRHSPAYVQCALLLESPWRARQVGTALAARLTRHRPDSILSPALGGLIIGHEVAASLGVPFRFVERKEGEMILRRGFRLRRGERVAVVEDVITTGGSCLEAAAVARDHGAEVVAVAAIIDRSAASTAFEVPYEHLAVLDFPTYYGDDCPLCAEGAPIDKPGSRPDD